MAAPPRPPSSHNHPHRLVIDFALLVFLPVVVISALSGVLGWQSGRQQVINQLESVATLKEAEIKTWVSRLQTNLLLTLHEHQAPSVEVLLQEPAATAADYQVAYDELKERFALMLKEAQLFEEVFLMDLQGRVVLSTDASQEGKIHSNQRYFWEGLEEARVHPPFYSPSLGRMSVITVRPVVDGQGPTLGVLAGRASVATLNEIMLEWAGLGETGETYLVGSNRVMLTRSRFVVPDEAVGTYVRTEGADAPVEDHLNGSGLYDDYRGVPVVGVYRWLPELQVALLAEQDQAEAFRPVYTVLGINAGVAAIALLGAIMGALFVARSIAAPLTSLARAATRIEAGDLSVRAPLGRDDEVGRLAASFNQMVEGIQQAQAELATSEERYRTLFERVPVGLYRSRPDGQILDVNPALLEMMGFPDWETALEVNAVSGYANPEDRARWQALMDREGMVRDFETQWRRHDGTIIWVEDTARAVRHAEGRVLYYEGVVEDITERKWAEEALRASEEKYRQLIELAQEGIWVIDKDANTIFVNPSMAEMLGYTEDEMQGKSLFSFMDEHAVEIATHNLERRQQGIKEQHDFEFLRKDGTRIYATLETAPITDEAGNYIGAIAGVIDITERKRAEDALRESERFLQDVFDGIQDGISVLDPNLNITRVNRWIQRMHHDEMPLIGKKCYQVYQRRKSPCPWCPSTKTLSTGEVHVEEVRVPYADGSFWWSELSAYPLRDENNKITGVIEHVKDITERKRAEEALWESQQLLENTFASLRDAVFIIDADTVEIIDCNPAASQVFGYERDEILGRTTTFLHADEAALEEFRQHLYPAVEEKGLLFLPEFRMKHKDGTVFPTEHSVVPLEDEQGERIGWVSVVHNITERKRAEERIRFLAQVLSSSPLSVVATDRDGRMIYVNRATEELFGYESDELLGQDPNMFNADPNADQIQTEIFDTIGRGEVWRGEILNRKGNGDLFPIQASVYQLADEEGNVIALVGFQEDITERKEMEEALQERTAELTRSNAFIAALGQVAARLQTSLEADQVMETLGVELKRLGVDSIVGLLEPDGQTAVVRYISTASSALTMIEKLIGRKLRGLRVPRLPIYEELIEHGRAVFAPSLIPLVSAALPGVPRPVLERALRLGGASPDTPAIYLPLAVEGQVLGVLNMLGEDLREDDLPAVSIFASQVAVALENARLYEAEHAARDRLRDLTNYLQTAREEERAYIAREIHDEFGQALTALKMDLSWLAKRLPADEPRLVEKASAMSGLVDDTIQTVRHVATELRPGLLDDLGLAAAIEWQTQEFAERTEIDCALYVSDDEIAFNRDLATAVFRILQETLTNVARHAGATEVRVELEVRPDELMLVVRDNGQGITESQVSDPRSLGLIGMRERARSWGGNVTFEGVPGQGTTVTVRMPRAGGGKGGN